MKSKQENTIRLVIWIFSKGFPCFRLYMPQRPKYFPSYINKGLTFDNVLDLITKITRKKKKNWLVNFGILQGITLFQAVITSKTDFSKPNLTTNYKTTPDRWIYFSLCTSLIWSSNFSSSSIYLNFIRPKVPLQLWLGFDSFPFIPIFAYKSISITRKYLCKLMPAKFQKLR